jgi:hypothetical protein
MPPDPGWRLRQVKALWRASGRIDVLLGSPDLKGSNPRTKGADEMNRIHQEAPYGKLIPMGKPRWEAILGRKNSLTTSDSPLRDPSPDRVDHLRRAEDLIGSNSLTVVSSPTKFNPHR